ncbi:MAG: hypothetical protein KAS84_08375 [Anaerolineales bacterium]|nr:hypothetical protein [Anaerolineales bacterium]
MNDQKNQNLQAISQGLLNLSGLGLGYLYQKRWRRWGIHLLITIGLLVVAFLTNASLMPMIWLPAFAVWVCWMAFDGWRLGRKLTTEERLFPLSFADKRQWLLLAIPVIPLGLVAAGLAGYYLLGQKEYQLGQKAYQDANCESAIKHFQRVTTLYELTFSSQISAADETLLECGVLLTGDQAYQDGKFEEAIEYYQDYLDIESDSLLMSYTEEAMASSYFGWAADLMGTDDYQEAITKHLVVLEVYPDTSVAEQVAAPLSESWLQLSAQLWKSGDYQEAVDSALISLEDYPSTSAGKHAADQIAEIYLDWAADLQSDDLYQEAVEKITLVLDEYPDTLAVENGATLAAEVYYDWASFLFETNYFGESIEKYEIILKEYSDYYSLSTINQYIKSSYLAWGIQLGEIGLYNRAIDIYRTFQDDYPQTARAADIPQLIIETQLEWAENLTQKDKFTQAMDKFTEIKDLTSDSDLIDIAEEGYQEALWGLSQDEGPEGEKILSEAFATACDSEPAQSPAIGIAEDEPAKARSCSSDLKLQQDLIAVYPGHFQYVVTRSDGYETIQSCPYQQGHTLIRQRQNWLITVRSTVTGNIYTSKRFYGSQPAKCEKTEWFSGSTKYKYGTEPSSTEVNSWLAGLFR